MANGGADRKRTAGKKQIARISYYEELMDRTLREIREAGSLMEDITDNVRKLETYLQSGDWMKDFEADENGLLPADLKRGVLSEDGLTDLFDELKELTDRFRTPGEDE